MLLLLLYAVAVAYVVAVDDNIIFGGRSLLRVQIGYRMSMRILSARTATRVRKKIEKEFCLDQGHRLAGCYCQRKERALLPLFLGSLVFSTTRRGRQVDSSTTTATSSSTSYQKVTEYHKKS